VGPTYFLRIPQNNRTSETGYAGQETEIRTRSKAAYPTTGGLELLGHAIEYLIDSRPFLSVELGGEDHKETLDILKCRSRQVFAECAEEVSPREHLKHWLGRILRY
jgi:hypothetical protein